ncbi:MAG: tRNA (adenosine(37)-N6)-threonylcarbamoyltransferase complex dimerization subunit type 1 TsaB [Prevotellaceae bacterium]|nr:tRNA (adenosine(37)-N6)-threonylcarbamoyltransferase complex dimerization subunit type 1 TsaB [Prevotellaceae bacterium]
MTSFLLIETGTAVCSVALACDSHIVSIEENSDGRGHAQLLAVFIQTLLQRHRIPANALSAVVVSEGPGSYTGLRVGVSTAKGLCYAANKPLIAINSLRSLAQLAIERRLLPSPDGLIAPMIDARRMEVYTALFDAQGAPRTDTTAEIITADSFADLLAQQPVLFVGDGVAKCRTVLQHPNAHFADLPASAAGMLHPAIEAFEQQRFVDVAYFEPFYLKDFVATKRIRN